MKLFVVVAALSLFAGRTMAQSTGHDIAENLKSNVVRIEATFADHTENGFGFIVGERGGNLYVATANHVIYQEDAADLTPATVKVEFYDRQGTMFDANLIGTHDVAHDLAVLTVAPPQGFEWKKQCLGRAEHRKRSSEVWFIGKSRHWVVPVIPGRVASEEIIDGLMDLENLPIQPGSSGGPLVASSGIVGIVLRDAEDNATALDITYVRSYFKKWNHPWDLATADAAVAASSVAPAPPVAPAPTVAQAPVVNPLHEGSYELYKWNGEMSRPGIFLRLRKVSDDYFLAESTTPAGDPGWSGELRRSGNGWDLQIADVPGTSGSREGTPRNPGSGSKEISKEGPLLTFKSEVATFVWKEANGTPNERPTRTATADPAPSSDRGSQIFGAILGTLIQSQTADRQSRKADRCVSGYVWREAGPNDHVCVTGETRRQTAIENASAASRRNPNGGTYGRDTCLEGYVWREAFQGDHVCVTADSRSQAAADNRDASSRVAH